MRMRMRDVVHDLVSPMSLVILASLFALVTLQRYLADENAPVLNASLASDALDTTLGPDALNATTAPDALNASLDSDATSSAGYTFLHFVVRFVSLLSIFIGSQQGLFDSLPQPAKGILSEEDSFVLWTLVWTSLSIFAPMHVHFFFVIGVAIELVNVALTACIVWRCVAELRSESSNATRWFIAFVLVGTAQLAYAAGARLLVLCAGIDWYQVGWCLIGSLLLGICTFVGLESGNSLCTHVASRLAGRAWRAWWSFVGMVCALVCASVCGDLPLDDDLPLSSAGPWKLFSGLTLQLALFMHMHFGVETRLRDHREEMSPGSTVAFEVFAAGRGLFLLLGTSTSSPEESRDQCAVDLIALAVGVVGTVSYLVDTLRRTSFDRKHFVATSVAFVPYALQLSLLAGELYGGSSAPPTLGDGSARAALLYAPPRAIPGLAGLLAHPPTLAATLAACGILIEAIVGASTLDVVDTISVLEATAREADDGVSTGDGDDRRPRRPLCFSGYNYTQDAMRVAVWLVVAIIWPYDHPPCAARGPTDANRITAMEPRHVTDHTPPQMARSLAPQVVTHLGASRPGPNLPLLCVLRGEPRLVHVRLCDGRSLGGGVARALRLARRLQPAWMGEPPGRPAGRAHICGVHGGALRVAHTVLEAAAARGCTADASRSRRLAWWSPRRD